MKKKKAVVRKDMCIECAHCDLTVDFYAGSHYTCLKTRKSLPSAILDRHACEAFVRPRPRGQWGA